MGVFDVFKRKESEKEGWVVIKPAKVRNDNTDDEEPMVIRDDEKKIKRMSKAELKKYFPELEFD